MDQPVLHTPRLLLRPFEPSDAAAVQRHCSAWEIADTTERIPHPYPGGAAEDWIRYQASSWESGRGVGYALIERSEESLIGAVGLRIEPQHARAELGYWIAVSRWNRGYATEASRAVLELAFARLHLHRVQATCLTRNPASGRVMQKLGMQFEGIHRDAFRKWSRFESLAVYAVLAREWQREEPP